MCGIAGFLGNKNYKNPEGILKKMTRALRHRGPDSEGFYFDRNIFFGHRRLSILDPTNAGDQPMHSMSKNFLINFNGEIYNYKKIREEIKKVRPTIFKGTSDTEILLEAIDIWGLNLALKKIDGMFAFALWDYKKKCLYLVRDRFGEKPLYYYLDNGNLIFASEIKSIEKHPDFHLHIKPNSIKEYLQYGYIGGENSIYNHLNKIRPGHYITFKKYKNSILKNVFQYWSSEKNIIISKKNSFSYLTKNEIKKKLNQCLIDSVNDRMIADVPIGCLLSGGIDSSLIASLMQNLSLKKINTFTVGIYDKRFNEASNAKKIASHLGTNHTEIYFDENYLLDIIQTLPFIFDEPFADSSQLPTILISKILKKNNITVALTGDGGDELFGGYNRHFLLQHLEYLQNKKFLKPLIELLKFLSNLSASKIEKFAIFFNFFLSNKYKLKNFGHKMEKLNSILKLKKRGDIYNALVSILSTDNILSTISHNELINKYISLKQANLNFSEEIMLSDLKSYLVDDILVKVDRSSMSEGVETRIPYLGKDVFTFAWKIPEHMKIKNSEGKLLLKEIAEDYIPANLLRQPKMGFAIPLDKWFRGTLKKWAEDMLDIKQERADWIFQPSNVKKLWDDHQSGKSNNSYKIWNILILKSWLKKNKII